MIKVVGEKVVKFNDSQPRQIKVKKLKGLGYYDLPHEYKTREPYCYFGDGAVYVRTGNFRCEIKEGSLVPQETWHKLIDALFMCGERLKGINEKIKKETEGWSGTIEIEI